MRCRPDAAGLNSGVVDMDGMRTCAAGASKDAHRRRAARDDTAELLLSARRGDELAWDALIERFSGLVWTVARSLSLSHADAAEVTQTTWLRLAEHLHRIEHPERLGSWLVTTTRREGVRSRRLRAREEPQGTLKLEESAAAEDSADSRVLVAERDEVLYEAFTELPSDARILLAMLMCDPPMSYSDISRALGMPLGSIGPTRARLLETLRRRLEHDASLLRD
jgi:RNA polymerase sigma factor (sigma-70 family)